MDTCQEGGQGGNRNRDILDEEYTSGTETVLARLVRPDLKSRQVCECGALESGGCDAKQYVVREGI